MYTPACTGAYDTFLVHTTLSTKIHIHPRKLARATVQQLLRHANNWSNFAIWALPKKPSESTPAYGAVAAASSHRHYLIICLGAGPIQFFYGSHSKLGHGAYSSQISISTFFFAESWGSTIVLASSNIESLYPLYCPFLRWFEDGRAVTGIAVPEILQGILTFRLAGKKFGHPAQNEKNAL